MTTTAKESLVRRIRALLSKTVENGATEAEAMSALIKAQEIMSAHGLDQEAVEAEAFVRETYASKQAVRGFYWGKDLAYAISQFTGSFCWGENVSGSVVYAGRESDAIFAYWLTDALDAFVSRNAASYISETGGVKFAAGAQKVIRDFRQNELFGGSAVTQYSRETDKARAARMRDFGMGVCARINQRLLEMATDETKRRSKDARRRVESEGMSFSSKRAHGPSIGDRGAYAAGQRAGDGAQFSKPMSGGAGPRLIAHA